MTADRHPRASELLSEAGRLLLESSESAAEIDHALGATAQHLSTAACRVVLSYERVAVSFEREPPIIARVKALRFNAALQTRVHALLARVRRHELGVDEALSELSNLERDAPRHSPWLVALFLGCAAASLARLLGADVGASGVNAAAVAIGFLVRHELGRRGSSALPLPFVAAWIGAVLGGLAIRWGWTSTPALALIVPSLILVPGPHIINGLLDLVDNYVPMGIARLALAASILVAAALGIVVGIELTLGEIPEGQRAGGPPLKLAGDMVLAGLVTCGFALAYNTEWSHVGLAVVGGMAGHGLRFLALQWGCLLGAATFAGGFTVGIVSAYIARTTKSPIAVVAFAGAATMMPGAQIYRALGGALKLARLDDGGDASALQVFAGSALQACVVAGALALGLVAGMRTSARFRSVAAKH